MKDQSDTRATQRTFCKQQPATMRWRRFLRSAIPPLLALGISVSPLWSRSLAEKKRIARTQFETAERMREALNGRPEAERRIRDYQRVIDAYRRVYYVAPTSVKADSSVVAVAELLAEKGHLFKDDKALQDAIGQYQFLRREYPGSKYRVEALFTIGQIYKDDLDNGEQARASFEEFLKRYPQSQLADDAHQAIRELEEAAKAKEEDKDRKQSAAAEARESRSRPLLVTGIRHWSTPDYTRVAIDLEGEVRWTSERIDHPDRIYFDLKDTRLTSTLKGKSFDVQDGFLKKIRVAQFQPGQARVVLEMDSLSQYSAFLLPNPYRLIIDIHGKKRTPVAVAKTRPSTSEPAHQAGVEQKAAPKDADAAAVPPLVAKNESTTKTRTAGDPTTAAIKSTDGPAAPAAKTETVVSANAKTEAAEAKPVQAVKVAPARLPAPQKLEPSPAKTELANAERAPIKFSDAPARGASTSKRASRSRLPGREARPTADGDRSLIRALGLKIGRIVVDAGHGGHDTGTIGPGGLTEKELVLDVALRLGKLLEARLGADVVYTRDDDTFIPLETRTAIANQKQADLFISVHANSSSDPAARGVETYYLNFTSSPSALEVAARENAVSDKSIHELQDLVKKIALKEKIEESREFAHDVQQALWSGLSSRNSTLRDRGVKKAPFIVLIGANMPSILAEISFISNPGDEKRLRTPQYRQKIAESLYRGIARYVGGLSGVKLASKLSAEQSR